MHVLQTFFLILEAVSYIENVGFLKSFGYFYNLYSSIFF
jgi:hypothetical protein